MIWIRLARLCLSVSGAGVKAQSESRQHKPWSMNGLLNSSSGAPEVRPFEGSGQLQREGTLIMPADNM